MCCVCQHSGGAFGGLYYLISGGCECAQLAGLGPALRLWGLTCLVCVFVGLHDASHSDGWVADTVLACLHDAGFPIFVSFTKKRLCSATMRRDTLSIFEAATLQPCIAVSGLCVVSRCGGMCCVPFGPSLPRIRQLVLVSAFDLCTTTVTGPGCSRHVLCEF